ncbi:MAG: hypothetical protein GXP14_13130 [Gammaproteobacteria bacterium]|nr:hypothetical protein [Gammaproteobacteria bacterium]
MLSVCAFIFVTPKGVKIVNDTAIKRIVGGLSPYSTNTSGYGQALQLFRHKTFRVIWVATVVLTWECGCTMWGRMAGDG